jgi:hypothetical protein
VMPPSNYPALFTGVHKVPLYKCFTRLIILACSLPTAYVPVILAGRLVGKGCSDFNA